MRKVIRDCRTSSYATENNDCTVSALATAAQLPYEHAYRIMAHVGRKQNGGGNVFSGIVDACVSGLLKYTVLMLPKTSRTYNADIGFTRVYGKPRRVTRFVGPSIKKFIELHPQGRYIVRIKKHAFALVDGVMYDRFKQHAGAIVKEAYKIEPIRKVN